MINSTGYYNISEILKGFPNIKRDILESIGTLTDFFNPEPKATMEERLKEIDLVGKSVQFHDILNKAERLNESGELNDREYMTVICITEGKTYKEIGEILGWTENTTKEYYYDIIKKLDN